MRIGQSQLRFEDDALIRGQGRYTADVREPNEATMVLLRSPVAAGTIRAIDSAAASRMPGVIAIVTGRDMAETGIGSFQPRLRHPGPDGEPMRVPLFRPLTVDRVRYLGEPVAAVIAETRAQAEDAAEAIGLDIEDEPSVVDCVQALSTDSPRVWAEYPDNRCFLFRQGDEAAVKSAFERAARVVRQRMRISRVTAVALEPRGALASFDPDSNGFRLDVGTQSPHRLAAELGPILGVSAESMRVVARDCGGSFGMKNVPYPEYVIALWAARHTGRLIRWTASRLESFQADAHARDQWADAALALDADGHFLALDVQVAANLGAYLGPSTPHPPTANVGGLAGVYRTPAIHVRVDGIFTNTQQTAPYRGAGRPEATYVIERMIDLAAAEMGIDRAELRRRNLIAPTQMPFKTGLVFTYDSGDFPALLDRAVELVDWEGFEGRRDEAAARGKLRGIGIANPIEIAGGPAGKPNPEFARLTLSPDGSAVVVAGSFDTGQGHGTSFRQILADRLGIDPLKIRVVTGDTGVVPQGTGSFGSRTASAAGAAIVKSADEIVARLKPAASDRLEAAAGDLVFADGFFSVIGTDRRMALTEVIAGQPEALEAQAFMSTLDATFPNGCHICEVEVDPDTGGVEVLTYVVVDDVGRVINPLLVKGQIVGGVAQGLGQALMEQTVYDPETGQLLSATLMDYAMPRAYDLPSILVESFPVPTESNPLGVKGAGEAGTVGSLSAVISAVCDALSPFGIRHVDMPATPERIWQSLRDAKAKV